MYTEHFNMHFVNFCVIMSLWKISEGFRLHCPVQSHWKLRAGMYCGSMNRYFCLFDQNKHIFSEFCRKDEDFDAPGQKLTVSGSIDGTLQGDDCENDFYQPFKFFSSGNSLCVYRKSYCSEEGQVLELNGTLTSDRLCRCDYTRGYDFINKPKHRCYCKPSEEDCSCHLKICPSNYILSQDYECLKDNEWKLNFHCKSISTTVLPRDTDIPSIENSPLFYYVLEEQKGVLVAVLVMFVLVLSLSIIFCVLPFLGDCIRIFNCTDINTIPSANRDEKPYKTIDSVSNNDKSGVAKQMDCKENIGKVPYHVLKFQNEILLDWERKLKKIVKTRATEFIYEKCLKRNAIVIAGPSGAGKSAIAYYSAFRLKEESGYEIIPARQPLDIINYHVPGTKQIFIIDDFIGKYTVDETDVNLWGKSGLLLNLIFSNNDDIKLILTSRTYIWQPERYTCIFFSAYTCDLLSDDISLLLKERWSICHSHLNQDDIKALEDETILMYSFFPYLCSSYISSTNIPVEHFFTVPYEIIEDEINNFKIKSQVSFIALGILAIKQKISKKSFSIDNHEYDELFQDVFHESSLLQYPSKNLLKSKLVALTGTYVTDSKDNFMLTHETLLKIVLRCIAETLIKSVIKYCEPDVILNQIRLEGCYGSQDVFTIGVTEENEDTYFRRLVCELGNGWNKAIFQNEQHKLREFRLKFLKYLKKYTSRDYSMKIQDDMPILHIVSVLGYKDYASFFMQYKTYINQKDSDGNIPLHLACMKGHKEIVQNLVEKKSIIYIANNEGLQPFVYACENNVLPVVKYLLHYCSKWINVNEKYQKRGKGTVLHIVSAKGFVNIVLLLLRNNADVEIQDVNGCRPLHLASDEYVVHALLACNANINAVDSCGRSPLYLACLSKNERVIQLLIGKNAEINQKTINGLRPIHAACQSGSIGIVNLLLERGARINMSRPGIVALHEACKIGIDSIVNLLIESNASVNHKTKDGLTPLHQACIHKHIGIAKKLLDNNANVNEANKYGWTAIFFGCAKGFCTIVDLLLQHGAYVNICDEDKVNPLMAACEENHTDVVDLLLRSNANVNDCNKDNCSSLLVACKSGNADLVSVLLRYSADINLADKDMITPLHAACMNNNNTKLVLKLVESNANVNAADKKGQTPLFKSIVNGCNDIVDILLRHGAFIDICDTFGLSPVAIANIEGNKTVIDALKQHRPINKIV